MEHGQADLVGAVKGRLSVRLAHMQVSHDVFTHDDSVVDQDADGQRESQQRHHVEAEAEHVEHDHRADDRNGQGEAGNDRGAPGIEEDENDHHRQNRALDEHVLHRVEGVFHRLGVIDHDLDLDRIGRQFIGL
jgi:hypothetical protein